MARKVDSDFSKLVGTIDAMQRLVEEGPSNRLMLYGEQCKEVLEEFKRVRYRLVKECEGGESSPILRELFRMACGAMTLLNGCIFEDQTSLLQAALIQNDKTLFTSIVEELKWGFKIFLEVGNLGPPAARCCRKRDISPFDRDRGHLESMIHEVISVGPEQDRPIAEFLLARLRNPGEITFFADRVASDTPWDPNSLSNNNLGRGSFGTVQAIRWFDTKLARKEFSSSEECLNEIRIMAGLNHHNVVRFISSSRCSSSDSSDSDQVCPAIIMECMEMTLKKYLKKCERQNLEGQGAGWLISHETAPFGGAPDQILIAVDIMYQIASGMAYLHEDSQVAHRDLKLDNILINECKGGEFPGYVHVKIGDLGLSKMGVEDDVLINSKENCGATPYRAPEMYKSGAIVLPKKADVYSFGIICWEILHGKQVELEGLSHLNEYGPAVKRGIRPVMHSSLREDYLGKLIERCWHPDPCRRPCFSDCSLALQSYKAKRLGSGVSLFDFTVSTETLEARIKRLWKTLLLHVKHRRRWRRGVIYLGDCLQSVRFQHI